ncbi:MAG: hypothetical protein KF768_00440 [Phycisphaeraceae bacterium]|nr:hypothetical protein [Phycisphaeraceae bacterium]
MPTTAATPSSSLLASTLALSLVLLAASPRSSAEPDKPASNPGPQPRDVAPAEPGARTTVQWVTREVRAPGVTFHTFDSDLIKGKVSYHLYRPAAYTAQPDRRFPVVYWLHGSGGGLPGIARLAEHFDRAIEVGKAPPFLVVFVNGLVEGMYVDWKDGSVPLESVIVKELVPHVDATHRTIPTRQARLLDGFSMGGYGAARLGFEHRDLFASVSMIGAGPMQAELVQAPRAGRQRAAEVLQRVYGGDQSYFRRVSPRAIAERHAESIAKGTLIRIVIGDLDETYPANLDFHRHLESLNIPHTWKVLKGVAHDPMRSLEALGDENWSFYRAAFDNAADAKPNDDPVRSPDTLQPTNPGSGVAQPPRSR